MAFLINRNPPARAQCLHALSQFAIKKFPNEGSEFSMSDIKYNPEVGEINIFQFCRLLKTDADLGIQYCPYKTNPLSRSGCGLTNGVLEDSTKSKEVSNTVNAMHSLGLFHRNQRRIRITELGRKFAKSQVNSDQYISIFRESLLKNGLMIGLLGQLYIKQLKLFRTDEIYVGYPNTNQESIVVKGERIIISSGSERDSNTRTKSCLLAWGITANFFAPSKYSDDSFLRKNDYVNSTSRQEHSYTILDFPKYIFVKKFVTNKPLDYKNLTKNTGALRENNQEKVREITLSVEHKIQNRRLAIILALNSAYQKGATLDLDELILELKKYPDYFVIDNSSFENIMEDEVKIGFVVGLPFSFTDDGKLKPLTSVDISELTLNAPSKLVDLIKSIV